MPELDDHDQQQVDLLICGGVVLPMTGADDLIWKGAVAVDGGKIVAVGADEELRRQFQPRRTIDASDQLVMPGLINTHMHLFGAFARGLVNDLSFTPWIQKKFYVTSSGLNPDNYFLGTQFTSIEMLKTGTTAFLDCGTYQGLEEAAVSGVEASGIRAVLARAMADVDDDLAAYLSRSDKRTRENLERAEDFITRRDGAAEGRIRAWPCPIQVTSSSDELCLGAMELAERYDVGVVTHSNVDREDNEAHELRFGSRPIERCEALGILNRRFVATHMAWLSEREVDLVKRRVAVIFGRWRSLGVLAAALVLGGANALQLRVGEQPYIEAAFWGALALVAFALLGGELLPNRGRLRISAVTLTGLAGIASVVLLITQPHISLSQPLWVGFPYVVALLVLAGARTSARMPSALAVAYCRGQR
jgi:hypothetical protein